MTVTITHADKDYECRYWNDTDSEWASDGLTTIVVSSTEIECNTTHLTSFTLIAVDQPSTEVLTTTLASTTLAVTTSMSGDDDSGKLMTASQYLCLVYENDVNIYVKYLIYNLQSV